MQTVISGPAHILLHLTDGQCGRGASGSPCGSQVGKGHGEEQPMAQKSFLGFVFI